MAFSIFDLLKRAAEGKERKKKELEENPIVRLLFGRQSSVPQKTTEQQPVSKATPLFDFLLNLPQSRRAQESVTKFAKDYDPTTRDPNAAINKLPVLGGIRQFMGSLDTGEREAYSKQFRGEKLTEEEKKKAFDYMLGQVPIGGMGFTKTVGNVKIFEKIIQGARSQNDAIQRVGQAVDATKKVFTNLFKQNAPEALNRLKATRAALNQTMYDMAGKTGNYKADYAVLQTSKNDPSIGKLIDSIESHVVDLDNIIKGSTEAFGKQLRNIPLRKYTRPGAYTNVPTIDNPLLRRPVEELPDVLKMARSLAERTSRKARTPIGESMRFVSEMADEAKRIRDPQNLAKPLNDLIRSAPVDVKKKVNVLDYLRTPNRVLEKIGLGEEAKLLRTKYDDYLQDLPKEIDRITAWSKRVGPGANERIFRYLDGKLPRLDNPSELKVANEVKTYLKQWADKLKLPEDKRISDYITHIFPKGAIEKEFDPEMAKLIRSKVVKSVYDPFLQRRVGMPDYATDTWQALDAYVKRATRKFHMDQALEKVAEKAENLPLESYNYVKGRIARINMQPSDVDNLIDNAIKSSPIGYRLGQRPVTAVTQTARQAVFRGLLGLNPGTALRNLQQTTNSYAVLGEKHFGVGLMKTVQNLPRLLLGQDTELEAARVLGKDIVQDRTINAVGKFWQHADDTLFYMFNLAEKVNRGIAYWGAKSQALSKNMNERQAIEYAKGIVGKTQFYYDVIDTPAALQSDLAKTLFQFSKYPLAQTEFLVEMVKDKNVLGSLRWIASNLLFVATAGKIVGLEPKDMFPDFSRFVPSRLTPPTLQLPVEAGKAVLNVPDQYGNVSDEQNPLMRILKSRGAQRGLLNYVPAGGQIRKSLEGAQAVQEGASLTPTGRVRFEVPQNFPTALRTVLFGQYSLPQAKEYFERRESGKSKSELLHEELKNLPREEANKRALEIKKDNPQLFSELMRVIKDEKLEATDDEKRIRTLPVHDRSRIRAIQKEMKGLSKDEKRERFDRLVKVGIISEDVYKQYMELFQKGEL